MLVPKNPLKAPESRVESMEILGCSLKLFGGNDASGPASAQAVQTLDMLEITDIGEFPGGKQY